MAVFGLTGGIGTGKSTVCNYLKEFGVAVVAADEVGRDVVAKGSAGLATIVQTFGHAVLDETGGLDRRQLGALIFKDTVKRRQLEAIIHPLVLSHSQGIFAALASEGHNVIIYESALLFESKRHLEMQGAILVTASEVQRIARVQQRDHCTEADVRARMQAQMSEVEKIRLADYIVDNNGDLQALRTQVQTLVSTLRHDAEVGRL